MTDNLFEAKYDLTKRSKFIKFYESNKILIYSSIFIVLIFFVSIFFYLENKKNKKILLSENYVKAKIYLVEKNKIEATKILKNIIFANDSTYSTLSFFLILDHDLVTNNNEVLVLFNHLLDNNKFETEIRNLLLYKKALFSSNFVNESELLKEIKPLLNENTFWKPHALLLLGDYFISKGEYFKAKEFLVQIVLTKNLSKDLYDEAKSRLVLIKND